MSLEIRTVFWGHDCIAKRMSLSVPGKCASLKSKVWCRAPIVQCPFDTFVTFDTLFCLIRSRSSSKLTAHLLGVTLSDDAFLVVPRYFSNGECCEKFSVSLARYSQSRIAFWSRSFKVGWFWDTI